MRRANYLLFIGFLLIFCVPAKAQEWQTTSLPGTYFSSLKKTSYGLMAGEFDTRLRPGTYNGVLLSKDFGKSCEQIGLESRGVTSIATKDKMVIAGTYYKINGLTGIFKLNNETGMWDWLNFNYSVTTVAIANNNVIVIGTNEQGLWTSSDNGGTWNQKIGSGIYGPKINTIESFGDLIIAGTTTKTYISRDNGYLWEEIPFLEGKNIKHIKISNELLVAGTFTNDGLYMSTDNGYTWSKNQPFGLKSVGDISLFKGCIYAGKSEVEGYVISKSCDLGATWVNLAVVTPDVSTRVNSMETLFSDPDILFISLNGYGVKMINLVKEYNKNPIFTRPWQQSNIPLIDYITSYFDHEYPLLGSQIVEPIDARSTTLNFLGKKEKEPILYYSSHNGTDFKLPYGTDISATDAGIAKYSYCQDCGNTIVIDHPTGYQTQYMHLQSDGLVTSTDPIEVTKGQVIGKVGMTGKTSGPHLHLLVTKDKLENDYYWDDYPWGVTDPFGWQTDTTKDPWEMYTDQTHQGTSSTYLWDESHYSTAVRFDLDDTTIVNQENITLNIPAGITDTPSTVNIQNYSRPHNFTNLVYIPATSYLIEIQDLLGNQIKNLNSAFELTYHLADQLPSDIPLSNIAIYFWNEIQEEWEALTTTVNTETNSIKAGTNHLSKFAVFGRYNDNEVIYTQVRTEGNLENDWYITYPNVYLSNSHENAYIIYSLDDGGSWTIYSAPIEYKREGIGNILYRAIYQNGFEEPIQQLQLKVNTKGNWLKTLRIRNSRFYIN